MIRQYKVWIIVVLVTGVVLLFSACAPPQAPAAPAAAPAAQAGVPPVTCLVDAEPTLPPVDTPAPSGTDAITIAINSSPDFNPLHVNDRTTAYTAWFLYDALMSIDEKGQLTSRLAKKVDVSADCKTYTFTLYQDIKFSDGTGFTAQNVVDAWNNSKDLDLWKVAGTVTPVDDFTITVILATPSKEFLQKIAPYWAIVKNGNIGTGPYKIVQTDNNGLFSLEPNDSYWGPETPPLKKINLKVIPDSNEQLAALQSHAINLAFDLPINDIKSLPDNEFGYITPVNGLTNGFYWQSPTQRHILQVFAQDFETKAAGSKPAPKPRPGDRKELEVQVTQMQIASP